MALITSSVSQVCRSLSQYLNGELNPGEGESAVRVILGTPSDASPADTDTDHRLNLFFFRFETSGFNADAMPGDIQFLRMYCLATPFAVTEGTVSSGENDLRIVGEAIRVFQEKPVFEITVSTEVFHIEVVMQTLGLDQINQLWSTQGETVYRPSVLFEVSLAPVIPQTRFDPGPLTATMGMDVRADINAPAFPSDGELTPSVAYIKPDTSQENWTPALAVLHDGGLHTSLSFELASPSLAAFAVQAWVAGVIGESITLVWERWTSESGWQLGSSSPAAISEDALDPDSLASATTQMLSLPFDDEPGQMVLYAERSYSRSSDGVELNLRSNPVLINLYGGGV